MTQFVLARHLKDYTREMLLLQYKFKPSAHRIYRELYDDIYELVTSVGDVPDNDENETAHVMGRTYGALLDSFGIAPGEAFTRIRLFATHVRHLQRATQYLCWVQARPGEVISLTATHTTIDARGKPLYIGFSRALETFWHGLIEPRQRRRDIIAKWYCEFGLAPMSYEFPAPGENQIGSYYFTIDAPPNTDIVYVDFEHTNTLRGKTDELDCSLQSVHIHNTEDTEAKYSRRARLIRAYLRCSSHGHKQIAAGALLNALFVVLVAHGGFNAVTSDSAQVWLLATPTLLTAYLVEQQRHYYAYATRRQRGILWLYLFISVAFLVTISFHLVHKSVLSSHWDWFSTAVGILSITSSAAVFTLYALLGYSFRYVTTVLTRKKLATLETQEYREAVAAQLLKLKERLEWLRQPPSDIDERMRLATTEALASWRCYEKVVHKYCGVIVVAVVMSAIGMGVSTIWWWSFPVSHRHHNHRVVSRHR